MAFEADLHILLIDINAVGYSAMYQPELERLHVVDENGEKVSTSAIHGATNSVLKAINRHEDAVPFILWDGRPQWRHDLLSEYKAHRTLNSKGEVDEDKVAKKEDYKRQSQIIKLLMSDLGIPQISCPDSEADDLAGHICKHVPKGVRITLFTHDTDWLQAVSEYVRWENFRNPGEFIIPESFQQVFKKGPLKDGPFESPAEYLLCKAVAGDSSDGIDGIPGVGIKTAKKIKDKHNGFEALYQMVEEGNPPKLKTESAVAHGKEIIERNMILMDWANSTPVSEYVTIMVTPVEDPSLYDTYQLKRLKDVRGTVELESRGLSEAVRMLDKALHLASHPAEGEGEF